MNFVVISNNNYIIVIIVTSIKIRQLNVSSFDCILND